LKSINFDHQKDHNNIGIVHASPTPVDKYQTKSIFDPMGNVWQWTRTPMYPFTGFEVHPIYDDFTLPTFDDKHNMIKGGSWISTGNLALPHSRYAFRRHFFQHAGFRLVEPTNQ
jgi:formylglycine-generating enzyme required for sulfatase activity